MAEPIGEVGSKGVPLLLPVDGGSFRGDLHAMDVGQMGGDVGGLDPAADEQFVRFRGFDIIGVDKGERI